MNEKNKLHSEIKEKPKGEIKKTLELSIHDKKYVIATDESEDRIHRAARLVDSTLRQIVKKVGANNESRVAVYAALQIACDLVAGQDEKDALQGSIDRMASLIDESAV